MRETPNLLFVSGFFYSNLIVYRNLKPLEIMAKFELKFLDVNDETSIKVNEYNGIIAISCGLGHDFTWIHLDKSTAIKFAKTLRTEINKITESEVKNG